MLFCWVPCLNSTCELRAIMSKLIKNERDKMNLGRFHSAVYAIKKEMEEGSTIQVLANLQINLQNSISQQTAESVALFKQSYTDVLSILENSKSNFVWPTRRQIYIEIGAGEFIGAGLADKIKSIISDNQIAPANALLEIQNTSRLVGEFYNRVNALNINFSELEIEYDDLESGGFEIGFSFPHEVIGSDLESLEKELHRVDFALKTFQEIATGKVEALEIRAISASEWQVFLNSVPVLAACTAAAIERIAALYKTNLEIKLLKKQLDDKKLPEEVVKPFQDYIKQTVKIELRNISDDLVEEFYKKDDEERKNELKYQMSQALLYVADRMDKGATVEVRAEPPVEPGISDDNDEQIVDQTLLDEYSALKAISDKVNLASRASLECGGLSTSVLSLDYNGSEKS